MDSESGSLDEMFSATYEHLRGLAARVRKNDASETLNPTALVNEAYLKLAATLRQTPGSRSHFRRIAARAMRQILIEAARRRNAARRIGRDEMVLLNEEVVARPLGGEELIALDEALTDLARRHPRIASVVEYRFFGGFTLPETAELLEISESTALRDWRLARAWLAVQLRRSEVA